MIGSLVLLITIASGQPTPISFRCDSMEVTQNPARSQCLGNAIAQQQDILICCNAFMTKADQDWQWKSLHCVGDVRAQRGSELAWANEAIFEINTGKLILEGEPILQRGKSLMQGTQIIIEKELNKARIIKPRGIMHHLSQPQTVASAKPISVLPSVCPLPARPAKATK
jgi:lipopolysaccharide export system protein LptA